MDVQSLAAVIGQRIRAAREEAGLSQDELAAAAQQVGLDWTRAAVAALETGRRRIDGEELLLLPAVLAYALGRPCSLADLLPEAAADVVKFIRVGRRADSLDDLRLLLAGEVRRKAPRTPAAQQAREETLELRRAVVRFLPTATRGGRKTWETYDAVAQDAAREAEQHAARTLNVTPAVVAAAARSLWGHGLSSERDERLAERASGAHVRARRGHVTRELIEELRGIVRGKRR